MRRFGVAPVSRVRPSREAAARWRTTGSGLPRKRARSRDAQPRARARTSRQSTNVMERSVVNEHSSCHICERRMATDDEPPVVSAPSPMQAAGPEIDPKLRVGGVGILPKSPGCGPG